jgi:hypothetical protein
LSVLKPEVELDEFVMRILKGQAECSKNKTTLGDVKL